MLLHDAAEEAPFEASFDARFPYDNKTAAAATPSARSLPGSAAAPNEVLRAAVRTRSIGISAGGGRSLQ